MSNRRRSWRLGARRSFRSAYFNRSNVRHVMRHWRKHPRLR